MLWYALNKLEIIPKNNYGNLLWSEYSPTVSVNGLCSWCLFIHERRLYLSRTTDARNFPPIPSGSHSCAGLCCQTALYVLFSHPRYYLVGNSWKKSSIFTKLQRMIGLTGRIFVEICSNFHEFPAQLEYFELFFVNLSLKVLEIDWAVQIKQSQDHDPLRRHSHLKLWSGDRNPLVYSSPNINHVSLWQSSVASCSQWIPKQSWNSRHDFLRFRMNDEDSCYDGTSLAEVSDFRQGGRTAHLIYPLWNSEWSYFQCSWTS